MLYAYPDQWFDAEKVSKDLRGNVTSSSNHLQILLNHGLLIVNEQHQYKYQPKTPELAEKVKNLHASYLEKPVAVVTCIFDKPNDKLKGFADAFKFKRD